MSPAAAIALRFYRWLARALPEDFLRAYGVEMLDAGEDAIRNVAARRGLRGLAGLMLRISFDLLRRVPAEHLGELASDVRHGIRKLARSKGMVLAVGLSIGVAIAISLGTYNEMSIVFHSVPGVGEPGDLLTIQSMISHPDFERYSSPDGPFATAAAYMGPVAFSVRRTDAAAERLWGQIVTPNYFEVLKVRSAAGRTFSGSSRGAAEVIISEGYWRRDFGGASDIAGRTLQVNGTSATIIGVAAKDFIGASPMTSSAEMWISTSATARMAPELAPARVLDARQPDFHLIGRLKSGVTAAQAEAQLDAIAKQIEKEKGETTDRSDQARMMTLLPGGQLFPIRKQDLPSGLAAPVMLEGLLLLLACTNASTLLLAKAGSRRREITVRVALGASRRRIIKQLLTESVLLGVCGGIVGLALAFLLNVQSQKAVASTFPSYIRIDVSMHWPAALLALGISVISGILFGVVPAFKTSRTDLASDLKAGHGWFLPGYRWFSSRNGLILLQVASSTAVVILVGILASGYQRASNIADFGFDSRNLYTFSIDPLREGYSVEQASELLRTIPDKLRPTAGVLAVSVAKNPPVADLSLRSMAPRLAQAAPSQPAYVRSGDAKRMLRRVSEEHVGSGYFQILSVNPLRGRVFAEADRAEASRAIVINATLAQEAWPAEDPIGREIEIGEKSYEVLGVVNDFRSTSLFSSVSPLAFHLIGLEHIAQPASQGLTVIVRASAGDDIRDKLQAAFHGIDPNLTIFNINHQADRLNEALFITRFQTISYGIIGLFGLLLAAVGLAGVTAYSVAQRTKEIGIRVALGATRLQVLRIVSREGAILVLIGILAGEAVAVGLTGLLNAWYARLYEVTRTSSSDPIILIGVPALLTVLTMMSCYIPARRALRVDPVSALRQE